MANHWLGRKHSLESRKKMSISASRRTGRIVSEETRKKISEAHRGHAVSAKTRRKLSKARKGKPCPWMVGNTFGRATGGKPRPSNRGSAHYRWISDRTQFIKVKERDNPEYIQWRRAVWERDSFLCRIANAECAGRIEAHHILPWRDHPELRYSVNNGITLCHFHHPRKWEDERRMSPVFQALVTNTAH